MPWTDFSLDTRTRENQYAKKTMKNDEWMSSSSPLLLISSLTLEFLQSLIFHKGKWDGFEVVNSEKILMISSTHKLNSGEWNQMEWNPAQLGNSSFVSFIFSNIKYWTIHTGKRIKDSKLNNNKKRCIEHTSISIEKWEKSHVFRSLLLWGVLVSCKGWKNGKKQLTNTLKLTKH